uniref:Dynactin subunit 4 n=1 Tax=Haemonchus contortus TaxID=6289 RepID=A0A7I4YLZ0_HAECO
MASLFQMDRVLYQCGCDDWWPLCNLYFCRHCSILRCISCSLNEIDSTFCPNCLENIPAGEARVKKNRCINCNQCPVCSMVLTTRAVGESCHLMCSTCRWSTRDSGTPDQPSSINWPVHESTLDKELGEVLERMRVLAAAEKAQRDQVKLNKRRSHNVGNLLTDRYGLQAIYQKRKKTFEKPSPQLPLHASSEEVPELDLSAYLDDSVETTEPSLESRLRQPLAAGRPLRPVRMPLKARKAIRCKQCDHNLVKLEYGTSTIRYKIQYFARNFVPEIRLSREPELSEGQTGSVLLTVANESNSKSEVIIMADNDDGTVECLTPVVELCLPSSDDTADIYDMESDRRSTCDGLGTVVFRRRHRAGVRLEVNCGEACSKKVLSLLVKYRNEQCSMQMNVEPEWRLTRVQISLAS